MRFVPVLLLSMIGSPIAAQTPARWEYATLGLVSGRQVVPVWNAGDSTAVLEWVAERDIVGLDTKPRTIRAASSLVLIMNALGEQGWELVSRESSGVTAVYVFKRKKGT